MLSADMPKSELVLGRQDEAIADAEAFAGLRTGVHIGGDKCEALCGEPSRVQIVVTIFGQEKYPDTAGLAKMNFGLSAHMESSTIIILFPLTVALSAVSLVLRSLFFLSLPVPTVLPMYLFFTKPVPYGMPEAFA